MMYALDIYQQSDRVNPNFFHIVYLDYICFVWQLSLCSLCAALQCTVVFGHIIAARGVANNHFCKAMSNFVTQLYKKGQTYSICLWPKDINMKD